MAPFFQQSVNLYAFVGPFSRCALVVGLLPLRRTSWRVAEKPWVILEVYIYNTSISGFCAAIVAQAQPFSVFCLRANIFGSVPLLVSAIGLHGKSQRADWHTVGVMLLLLHILYTAAASCAESRIKAEIFQSEKNALMQASPCSMAGRSWREARSRTGKTGSPELTSVKR